MSVLKILNDVLEQYPSSTAVHFTIGNTFFGTGHFKEAEASYREVLKSNETLGIAHYYLALVLTCLDRNKDAIQHLYVAARHLPKKKGELVWGVDPILNNKYWSLAMRRVGYASKTLMDQYSVINKREDYDLLASDLVPSWVAPVGSNMRGIKYEILHHNPIYRLNRYFSFLYILLNASVLHTCFRGVLGGATPYGMVEAELLKIAGIKSAIHPYGSDYYRYSQVPDLSLRHALLLSYPEYGRNEDEIAEGVAYWVKRADVVIPVCDQLAGRWDVMMVSSISIDVDEWQPKTAYSDSDGRNGRVRILHTPNHRGFKGTEFVVNAVEEFQQEGLDVELVLLEKVQNKVVRSTMQEVDILADQFIATGYALSAIEGMASGLPVLCNLDNPSLTTVYRRYSFLDECPILSTTPETLKRNLRVLVEKPVLRRQLGQAGRQYAEKYHSFKTSAYMFGAVYDKLLKDRDINLMTLFHPLLSDYNKKNPIKHPLRNNHLDIT